MDQTETQIARARVETMEIDMIRSLSLEANFAMIKIALTWPNIVGSSGSWVSKSQLKTMLSQDRPWSANKLTFKGQGRNGIVYSLIPMLKDNNLVVVHNNTNVTRYDLTEVGVEVIRAMIWNCEQCNNTRVCTLCTEGKSHYRCSHYAIPYDERQQLNEDQQVERCTGCDEEGDQLCTRCEASTVCHYCKPNTSPDASRDASPYA